MSTREVEEIILLMSKQMPSQTKSVVFGEDGLSDGDEAITRKWNRSCGWLVFSDRDHGTQGLELGDDGAVMKMTIAFASSRIKCVEEIN